MNLFDNTDIEERTNFKTEISDINNIIYSINCRLWKKANEEIIIFCNFDNIPKGNYYINLNNTIISYNNYKIMILLNNKIQIEKLDLDIIDIYSNEQFINIEDNKELYEIKFKINSYNNEHLFLIKELLPIYLDNCEVKNKELKCFISKNKIEELLSYNNERFWISFFDNNNQFDKSPLISDIYINDNNIQKKVIYLEIKKLLSNIAEKDTVIAYETNVTDISRVMMSPNTFNLNFNNNKISCSLRKFEENPLLLICIMNKKINNLGEIKEEIKLDYINIKYNFSILPVNNNEPIIFNENALGSFFISVYPDVLDFTSKDSISIEYIAENPEYLNGITLNSDSTDLKCENIKQLKRCIVPKSHFNGKKSGYYFTNYKNHLNSKTICYNIPPIKVILPNSNNSDTSLYLIIGIIVTIIIIFVIILIGYFFYKKKKSTQDIKSLKEINLIDSY